MSKLRSIMLAGTGSDVGKSLVTTAISRILLQDGYHPAPFKAQNMAPYYFTTPKGEMISIAQAIQAKAAGLAPNALMNPVLMMPSSVTNSKVICLGEDCGNKHAREYFRESEGKEKLRKAAWGAYDQLRQIYNPIVLEGAGSVSELNLLDTDFVNMPMAEYADAAVILIADIERGGVFASVYGSIMLQKPEHKRLIKGIIINKFRGDIELFNPARKMIEELCGVPVLGVIPYLDQVDFPSEDTLSDKGAIKVSYTTDDLQGYEHAFDQVADHFRKHLDLNKLYSILSQND